MVGCVWGGGIIVLELGSDERMLGSIYICLLRLMHFGGKGYWFYV